MKISIIDGVGSNGHGVGPAVALPRPSRSTTATRLPMNSSIGRRGVFASLLALVAQPRALPAPAAPPALEGLQATLIKVDGMLGDASKWPQAAALLEAPELQEKALAKIFDAVIDPPTLKDRAMDQAAFIVYYEEKRYNDFRLEPQEPSRRANQNGLKREILRAVADERAEVEYLIKAPGEDPSDLLKYSRDAREALSKFLKL